MQIVGGVRIHQELWVPAEELDEFNSHIIGKIVVEKTYVGEAYAGQLDPETQIPIGLVSSR